MLKLERIAKTLNLSITLRKKEPFFNQTMLKALALGLVIHVGSLLLFPIAAAKFAGSLSPLPPINVVVDFPMQGRGDVTIEIEENRLWQNYLKPMQKTVFVEPAVQLDPLIPPMTLSLIPSEDPLQAILDPQQMTKPFDVHVYGPLSLYKRVSEDPSLDLPSGTFKLTYKVAMENRKGKIFWYQLVQFFPETEKRQEKQIHRLAEEIIKKMLFEKTEEAFVTDGMIEIAFSKR